MNQWLIYKELSGPMRLLLALLLTMGMGPLLAATAHAQPAMLEAQPLLSPPETTAQTPTPETISPNLTPDTITPRTYGFTAPTEDSSGRSTISPRHEPWQKDDDRQKRAAQAQAIFAKLPAAVQDQILNEAQDAHRQCNLYGIYAQLHDCDCIGSVYFDERVLDPESAKDTIVGRIARQCVSLPGASAYGYAQCHSGMRFVLVPQRAEDFCKCYATEFGKNYQRSPYPDFDNIRAIGKRTNSHCIRTVPYAFKSQLR